MRRLLVGAGVAAAMCAAVGLGGSPPASAVTYEPLPPFCDGAVLHDYLAPFERMRTLHKPPTNGRIGFGPASLRLKPFSSLLVGKGYVGYKLFRLRGTPNPDLDWDVTTMLARVDWRGRPIRTIDVRRRPLPSLGPRHDAGASFEVGASPAAYRVTVVFHNATGRKLGSYGVYFRVVAPTENARLSLNASSYSPEQIVFGRIENLGTATVLYGAPYVIERLEGSSWVKAPESPGAFILPLYGVGAGLAGKNCSPFWIRPSMTGRYRMSKEIEFVGGTADRDRAAITLTAEFDIAP